jgi:hypothetical protein
LSEGLLIGAVLVSHPELLGQSRIARGLQLHHEEDASTWGQAQVLLLSHGRGIAQSGWFTFTTP